MAYMASFRLRLTLLCMLLATTNGKFLDLTYKLANTGMGKFPSHLEFKLTVGLAGPFISKYTNLSWVAMNHFNSSEHSGTHIDAPYHFAEKGRKVDELQWNDLHGPAVVIDIRQRAETDNNEKVMMQDLQLWEQQHGQIPKNAFVIMNSGWARHWGNQKAYTGVKEASLADLSFLAKQQWPGFSGEATEWLLKNREINGLGVDSCSCDAGKDSIAFPTHVTLLGADKVCLENMANVDKLPAAGAHLYALPLKIAGGSGAPSRVYALTNEESACGASITSASLILAFMTMGFTAWLSKTA